MRRLFQKYPILISTLLLIFISFPDVILGRASLMITDAVPFDGTSAYVSVEGREKISPLYYETHKNVAQGFFDAGGTIWQSESKIPFMKYILENGENPFWNPYQGAGTLGSETLVDIKFSPITFLAALLGASSFAYNFAILFFLTISTYCLIKLCVQLLDLPLIAGVAAAMAFLFNGFQTSGLASNYAQSYLLFPIFLYAFFAYVKYGKFGYFIASYLSCALILCLTFIPTTFLTIVTVVLLATAYIFQQPYSNKQKFGKMVGMGFVLLFALSLTAVLYLPIIQALSENKELGTYSARVFYPVTLNGLLSLFSPKHLWNSYVTMNGELLSDSAKSYFVGNNALFHIGLSGGLLVLFTLQKNLWQKPVLLCAWIITVLVLLRIFGIALYSHPENSAFTGNILLRLILLAGLVAGILSQKQHWKKPVFFPVWLIATLIILRLVGIDYYDRFVNIIPIIGSFGAQYIWIVVMICLPLFVAYGMSQLVQNPLLMKRTKYFLVFIFLLLISTLSTYQLDFIRKQNMVHLLAFFIFCGAIYYLHKTVNKPAYLKQIPLLLLCLFYIEYNYYVNHARPERSNIYSNTPDYINYIKQNIGNQRILNIGQLGIPAEQASAYQIQDISTMTNSTPPDYVDFYLTYLVPKEYYFSNILTFLQAKDTAQINMKMMSFMGVKYIIIQKDWRVWNKFLQDNLSPAFSTPQIAVYENKDVWSRAFFTTQSLEKLSPESIENGTITKQNIIPAEITSYHHDHLTISVDAPKAGILILTDNWHKYWFARIAGKEIPVTKVFGAFRGVSIPEGKNIIEFTYKNPAVEYGLKISKIALLITIILSLVVSYSSHFKLRSR